MSRQLDAATFYNYPTHLLDKNPTRQAYNRLVTARNINENHGSVLTEEYFDQFDEVSKRQIMLIGMIVKKKGIDYMRQEINKLTANEE